MIMAELTVINTGLSLAEDTDDLFVGKKHFFIGMSSCGL